MGAVRIVKYIEENYYPSIHIINTERSMFKKDSILTEFRQICRIKNHTKMDKI